MPQVTITASTASAPACCRPQHSPSTQPPAPLAAPLLHHPGKRRNGLPLPSLPIPSPPAPRSAPRRGPAASPQPRPLAGAAPRRGRSPRGPLATRGPRLQRGLAPAPLLTPAALREPRPSPRPAAFLPPPPPLRRGTSSEAGGGPVRVPPVAPVVLQGCGGREGKAGFSPASPNSPPGWLVSAGEEAGSSLPAVTRPGRMSHCRRK